MDKLVFYYSLFYQNDSNKKVQKWEEWRKDELFW